MTDPGGSTMADATVVCTSDEPDDSQAILQKERRETSSTRAGLQTGTP